MVDEEAGHEREARLDVLQELVERRRIALQDQRRADVDVDRPPLREERGHVGGGQTLRSLAHPASLSPGQAHFESQLAVV